MTIEQRFLKADELLKERRIADATALLEDILREAPDYGRAYSHLGWILENKLGELGRAEDCYRKALQYAPEYRPTYYNYAILLSSSRRFADLQNLLQQAEKVNGINFCTLHHEYGIMYEMQGLYAEAIDYYTRSLRETLDQDALDNTLAAIERCKKKKEVLS